jgi:DNA invertase Pin-like site-specific DNA recombinase
MVAAFYNYFAYAKNLKEAVQMNVQLNGYCRVSARDQNEQRQIIAMREFGVPEENIFVEKLSGKDFNRPVYQEVVARLNPGDVLVISSLDRLGREYDAVINEWRHLTKERKAAVVVLDMPLLDTRTKDRDLTASFVADLVLQILSYVAEKERLLNKQRQAEGIAAAIADGVKFGQEPMERPALFEETCEQWKSGNISSRDAGRLLGVSHTTFLRWVRDK